MKTHLRSVSERISTASTSEKTAADFFRRHGFEVFDEKHPFSNGPDLTIAKDGRTWRVEVKTVRRSSRAYTVSRARRDDDLIALVYKQLVIVQPMSDHLKCASSDRSRRLTDLLNLHLHLKI